ncbi:MAG TPA: hypothetical protein VN696_02750 [Pyrinomonadaceae bacterium]|nr:hypothetical protein [Pyrinomonadaceae bacterium]
MKTRGNALIAFIAGAIALGFAAVRANATPSDESDVRGTIQRVFDQLKSGQYGSLYDGLPSSSRNRIAKDRFVNGLERTSNMYQLQRIEIGAVRVSGNLAVADTTMFAHISKPFEADGKLVVQQYLIREDGQWRVATGDNATVNRFLQANPTFARRFPIKRPTAYVNQNGKWTEIPLGRRN